MAWHAHLQLHYRHEGGSTLAHDRHSGPLRVLQRLYPEGAGICHHVLVHPPGGIVGGDTLSLEARLDAGSHALITTPGATRFYRSAGEVAKQRVLAHLEGDARLEWLPLETIGYDGCQVDNTLRFDLASGAEMIGREVLALGLPAADRGFASGSFLQHLELPGAWLERGRIDAADAGLLESPLGWSGRPVLATMWFGAGDVLAPARRQSLLDAARAQIDACEPLHRYAGATAPNDRVVVVRALAGRVEPAMRLLDEVWVVWRNLAWGLGATPPRVWRT